MVRLKRNVFVCVCKCNIVKADLLATLHANRILCAPPQETYGGYVVNDSC
jgi:hypothetical protein